MEKTMKDRVALVTGGSRGIGRACCLELARRGATVVVNYSTQRAQADAVVAEIEKLGGRGIAHQGDVATVKEMSDLATKIEKELDGLDYLVNNAGVIRDQLLLELEEEDWDEVLRVNLKGIYACTRAMLPIMMGRSSGAASIVNLSSIASSVGSKGHVNYAASKGGVDAFTKALAIELAPKRIRVNAVAPGYIETEMAREVMKDIDPRQRIPLRRFGATSEIANVVAFLLSDAASYVTGEIVRVTGGIQ
ncbi:3-oxoacyl-ACP reductase FabG [Pendulispora rubella]|uniref:3-oxoacyl-ACP reductase FabG n=1 Tax=Pendulispora rubella TaxID=2741070 RepID=A0ABZ2L1G7_9BACT